MSLRIGASIFVVCLTVLSLLWFHAGVYSMLSIEKAKTTTKHGGHGGKITTHGKAAKGVCDQIRAVQDHYSKMYNEWEQQHITKDQIIEYSLSDNALEKVCFTQSNSAIVVSVYDEYPAWVKEVNTDIHIYFHNFTPGATHFRSSGNRMNPGRQHGDEKELKRHGISVHKIQNVGDEAHAYLAFIVKYYYSLPEIVAFVHADRRSAHHRSTLDGVLGCLCIDRIVGYQSINVLNEVPPSITGMGAFGHLCEVGARFDYVRSIWKALPYLKWNVGDIDDLSCFPMDTNAQFAVTRERILLRPRFFYLNMLATAVNGPTTWEYFWRSIFSSGSDCNGKWIHF